MILFLISENKNRFRRVDEREIQRVDTGEWVYGYLIVTNKDNRSFIQDCDYSSVSSVLGGVTTYCLSSYHYSQVEVIPETVGQYAGLKNI